MLIGIIILAIALSISIIRIDALSRKNKQLENEKSRLLVESEKQELKKMNAESAPILTVDQIVDEMKPTTKNDEGKKVPYFEFYKDDSGQFRWRFKAKNNKIVADSGESYTTKQNLKKGLGVLLDALSSGEYGKKDQL